MVSLERNLVVLSEKQADAYRQVSHQINIRENPIKHFSFPVSNFILVNNFSQKNFTLRLKSATEYYNNLSEIRKLTIANPSSVISEQLMNF